ncbi:MAG: GIY-YIG nuclease family protein [Gemmatimonadota bacterium]
MAIIAPRQSRLREEVREHVRNVPGVYRFRDGEGTVIYVGQSRQLRTRLLSYFRAAREEKAGRLIRRCHRVEWRHLPDIFTAVITEYHLIRRLRPRGNVQHRRRRPYAFIRIPDVSPPRLRLSPTGKGVPGEECYGPFPSPGRVARAVDELNRALGLRDCGDPCPTHFLDQLELLPVSRYPGCLRGEMGSCLAPCAGGTTERVYSKALETARHFLQGDGAEVLLDLRLRMEEAAGLSRFEHAAFLRDRLMRLEGFQEDLRTFRHHTRRLTFIYRPQGDGPGRRLHLIWRGRVALSLAHPRTARTWHNARKRVRHAVAKLAIQGDEIPPDAAGETFLVARWFARNPEERERTIGVERWLSTKTSGFSRPSAPAPGSDETPPPSRPARKVASA